MRCFIAMHGHLTSGNKHCGNCNKKHGSCLLSIGNALDMTQRASEICQGQEKSDMPEKVKMHKFTKGQACRLVHTSSFARHLIWKD